MAGLFGGTSKAGTIKNDGIPENPVILVRPTTYNVLIRLSQPEYHGYQGG